MIFSIGRITQMVIKVLSFNLINQYSQERHNRLWLTSEKVDYDNNTITLKDINQNLNPRNSKKLAKLLLLKKAKQWEYEQEWRIIVDLVLE